MVTEVPYGCIIEREASDYSHNEGNAYRGYVAGGTRTPTQMEIEAAAKACFEHYWADLMGNDTMRWPDDTSVIAQEIFRRIAGATLQAARLKAVEES